VEGERQDASQIFASALCQWTRTGKTLTWYVCMS
jgi:hypothetical protein